jgi:hypothetical protein
VWSRSGLYEAGHLGNPSCGPRRVGWIDVAITTATVDLDAGARWSETSRLAELSPFSAKLAKVGSIEVSATLGNVPASALTPDAAAFMAAMAAAEAGPVEIIVLSAAST